MGPRRIEDADPGQGPVTPGPGPAPDQPPEDATGGRLRPSRPQLNAPIVRISPEARREGVADTVREALPLATLADLIGALFVALSEADGAGADGHLSPIQCTQVAALLYDSTVNLVVSRFDGNISRFKAGMAVLLILVSKGSVHARAVRGKLAERATRPAAIMAEAAPDNGHVMLPGPLPVADPLAETYAQAFAREQAMRGTVVEG